MRADFERSTEIDHRGEKGTVREKLVVSKYLNTYLPKNVSVCGSCEVVDVTGARSNQVDIAIYDPTAPPLYLDEDFRIFPSECVYGTVEVKSRLTGTELKESMRKASILKQLQKSEFLRLEGEPVTVRTQYGKDWNYCPTVSFVFAFDSVDLDVLAATMSEHYKSVAPEHRLDAVWVLGKGFLIWMDPTGEFVRPSPEPDSKLAVQDVFEQQDVLLNMTLMLNQHFGPAFMPTFKLLGYGGDVPMSNRRALYTL